MRPTNGEVLTNSEVLTNGLVLREFPLDFLKQENFGEISTASITTPGTAVVRFVTTTAAANALSKEFSKKKTPVTFSFPTLSKDYKSKGVSSRQNIF